MRREKFESRKINIEESINLEYYYGDTLNDGRKIVKRIDALQYHYFAQDYNILDTAQMVVLVTLTHRGLKNYIGFVCLNSPTLDKTLRNKFFGKRFLRNLYSMYDGLKILNMSRIVFLPSYRGLGISKKVQDSIIQTLFTNTLPDFTDVVYIELSSIMLHQMDFASKFFNKTFFNSKDVLSAEDFEKLYELENNELAKGYKAGTSIKSQTVFTFNMNYFFLLQEYYQKFYNVTLTEADRDTLLNDVTDFTIDGDEPIIFKNLTSRTSTSNNSDYSPLRAVA